MESLGAQIRAGAKWLLADKVCGEVGQFAFGIILARVLLPEHFGLVATVGTFTGVAGFFSGAGTGQALVRAEEAGPRHFHVVFTLQLGIGCLIYAFFFLIAPWFAGYFQNTLYRDLLRFSALTFLLRPLNNVSAARLHRDMRFRPLTVVNAVGLLLSAAISIALAVMGWGAWSLVLAGVAGGLLKAVMLAAVGRYLPRLAFDREIARDLGSYGFKVATNNLLEYFRGQTPIVVLSKLRGPSEVGLYNRADGLANAPMRVVGTSPYQAVFRALATLQDNRDRSRYVYQRTITLVTTYTLPLYVCLWWLARPTILFLYGEKWIAAAEPLQILALTGPFHCVGNPSGAVIEARNRLNAEIALNIGAWALLAVGCFFGIRWGLPGVASAAVFTTVLFTCSVSVVAARELGARLVDVIRAFSPGLLLNIVLYAALALADSVWKGVYSSGSAGAYLLFMVFVAAVTYGGLFLSAPIGALSTEVARWKTAFGLSKK